MVTDAAWTDEQLLERYLDPSRPAAQRESAFRDLVARYRRRVFAVCFQVLRDPQDAEDAAQETFVRLARRGETFRGEAKLSTWLYRVARNVSTDHVRYDARRPSTPVEDVRAHDEPAIDDHAAASTTAAAVRAALAQLDDLSRRLLVLVAIEGLSYAEAAAATDLAVGTVKSRVSRARHRLGELLADDDADDPRAPRPSPGPRGPHPPTHGARGPPDGGATQPHGGR